MNQSESHRGVRRQLNRYHTANSGVGMAKGNRYLLRSVYRLFFMYAVATIHRQAPKFKRLVYLNIRPPPYWRYAFIIGGRITLTIYRHNHRWREFGDITSDGLWFNTLLRLSFSSLSSRMGGVIRISILISYSTLICGYCCVLLCIHPPSIFTYGPFWRRGCRPLFIRVAYRLRYQ